MTQGAENRMPTRISSAIFRGKATLLTLRRALQDVQNSVKRHPCEQGSPLAVAYPCVVAESRTPLYTESNLAERALQRGKVQNLRRALRHLNGMVIPADGLFSFWKQVGRATAHRGYVAGRQLREGCLFPAIGGGLCQLSNALYDVALQADCEIVERHPHTSRIPGSAAARNRDAAIAWNYIDLRFGPHTPLCLEAVLTGDTLIVRLRTGVSPNTPGRSEAATPPPETSSFQQVPALPGTEAPVSEASGASMIVLQTEQNMRRFTPQCPTLSQETTLPKKTTLPQTTSLLQATTVSQVTSLPHSTGFVPLSLLLEPIATRPILNAHEHSCVTCGVHACFRHDAPEVRTAREQAARGVTAECAAYLVDEYMPELAAYVLEQRTAHSVLMLPLDGERWKQSRYRWQTEGYARVLTATLPTLLRAYRSRALASDGPARRQAQLAGAERLAAIYAHRLPWTTEHVVVAQSLLPYLWRDGHLGGRTFDVLMTRLPIETLQNRLDEAFAAHPDRTLLHDFRAAPHVAHWEMEALRAARHIITPHAALAAQFPRQAVSLPWQRPDIAMPLTPSAAHGLAIAFPGPTHARKGAYELRAVAQALHLEVVLLGSELEGANFWRNVRTRRLSPAAGTDWLNGVGVVVQPALVEEQPRRLLAAIARGIPVIATSACGLGVMPGVTTVPAGDENALCEAIVQCLFPNHEALSIER